MPGSFARETGLLLRLRLRTGWNALRFLSRAHRIVSGLLFVGGIALFALILVLFAVLLGTTRTAAGPALQHSLIERTVLFLFLFLLSGGVPFVSSTLLTAGDLPLLAAAPVRPAAIVAARLVDAILVSSAQFVVIGVPLLIASAWALDLMPGGWLLFVVVLVLFLALPALLVATLLLGLARLLGMRRVRSAVALASAALAVGMCLLTVSEFSRQSSGASGIAERLRQQTTGQTVRAEAVLRDAAVAGPETRPSAWLPSTWVSDILIALSPARRAGTGIASAAMPLFYLVGAAVGTGLLCLWLGGPVLVGETLLEGEHSGSGRRGRPPGRQSALDRLLSAFFFLSLPERALIAKDLRYVSRDLVLLSQIGIPVILYLVPFVIAGQIKGSGASTSDLLALSVGIVATIVYMETSILSLSSVGLEGRAYWLAMTAPVSVGRLLRAKWWAAFGVSVALCAPLLISSCLVFGASLRGTALGTLALTVICAALCGLGVGLSALFPRFVYENPAHRASLSALIWGFVGATAYVLLAALFLGGGIVAAAQWPERAASLLWGGVTLFALLSLATGLVPLLWGMGRLAAFAWEES